MIDIHFSPIESLPDVTIQPKGPVSKAFLDRDVESFHQAARYVNQMPYGQNSSSENAMVLFDDGLGTCVTKHGVIARLAEELQVQVFRCEGFYQLTDQIVTGVNAILDEYAIPYIPRTHCFLSYKSSYIDLTDGNCTGKNGLIESYLKIFQVNPEQTKAEEIETYRSYYEELCAEDFIFAQVGVDKMLMILERCEALNTLLCQRAQKKP